MGRITTDAGGAFAAYIAGDATSNLAGRLISAGLADHLGRADERTAANTPLLRARPM